MCLAHDRHSRHGVRRLIQGGEVRMVIQVDWVLRIPAAQAVTAIDRLGNVCPGMYSYAALASGR